MTDTIQEMINTLQELQELIRQAPEGSAEYIEAGLIELQCGIDSKVDSLRISVEMAGKPEEIRVEAAAELVCQWWGDGGFAMELRLDELISEAVNTVFPDLQGWDAQHRSKRADLRQKVEPLARQLITDAKEQRRLIFDLDIARGMAERDRELLGLPADGELTVDQLDAARQLAEQKAGPAKNGRPFPRFKNAQQRLLLVMANAEADQ